VRGSSVAPNSFCSARRCRSQAPDCVGWYGRMYPACRAAKAQGVGRADRSAEVCACNGGMPRPRPPEGYQVSLARVQILNILQGRVLGSPTRGGHLPHWLKFRARNLLSRRGGRSRVRRLRRQRKLFRSLQGGPKGAGCAISDPAPCSVSEHQPRTSQGAVPRRHKKVRREPSCRLRVVFGGMFRSLRENGLAHAVGVGRVINRSRPGGQPVFWTS